MMRLLLVDSIQALLIGGIFYLVLEPSAQLSSNPEFLKMGREYFGDVGLVLARNLKYLIPFFIPGLAKLALRKAELMSAQQAQEQM